MSCFLHQLEVVSDQWETLRHDPQTISTKCHRYLLIYPDFLYLGKSTLFHISDATYCDLNSPPILQLINASDACAASGYHPSIYPRKTSLSSIFRNVTFRWSSIPKNDLLLPVLARYHRKS